MSAFEGYGWDCPARIKNGRIFWAAGRGEPVKLVKAGKRRNDGRRLVVYRRESGGTLSGYEWEDGR